MAREGKAACAFVFSDVGMLEECLLLRTRRTELRSQRVTTHRVNGPMNMIVMNPDHTQNLHCPMTSYFVGLAASLRILQL